MNQSRLKRHYGLKGQHPVLSRMGRADVMHAFVDEWKSGVSGQPDSPICYGARVLTYRDASRLHRVLDEAGASGWHASKNFGLFGSDHFHEVISRLFYLNAPYQNFDNAELRRRYAAADAVLLTPEEIAHLGRRTGLEYEQHSLYKMYGNDPYALGFISFVERLLNRVGGMRRRYRGKLVPIYLLVVCDNMCFVREKYKKRILSNVGPLHLPLAVGHGVRAQLVFRYEKTADIEALNPFMGLIDSDLWAFGKANQCKLTDGLTIRGRATETSDGARLPLSRDELEIAFNCLEPKLRWYLNAWLKWSDAKRVELL